MERVVELGEYREAKAESEKLELRKFKLQLATARQKGLKIGYIKGPQPLSWFSKASQLGGKCLNVAHALWYLHGLTNANPVKMTAQIRRIFSVERHSAYRALGRMEEAGLVQVERHIGRAPRVTLLEFKE